MNCAEYMTKEMDVLLQEGETPEALVARLNQRLAARVVISPEQYNSALTLLVTGTRAEIAGAFSWLANEGKPRFDLRGRPPVAKGERRIQYCAAPVNRGGHSGHTICGAILDGDQCPEASDHIEI